MLSASGVQSPDVLAHVSFSVPVQQTDANSAERMAFSKNAQLLVGAKERKECVCARPVPPRTGIGRASVRTFQHGRCWSASRPAMRVGRINSHFHVPLLRLLPQQ